MLLASCALLRRPDQDAPCPGPPNFAAAKWTQSAESGVIQGIALHADSLADTVGKRLSSAAELVAAGPVKRVILLDSSGRFRLAGLPSGDYVVTVKALGYPTRRDSLHLRDNGASGVIRLGTYVNIFPACCHSLICL